MPRNGAGSATLAEPPFVYDTVISETAMNSNLSDIAAMLTASIAKDGQTTPTANLPMGTYKHTGANTGSGANSGEYVVRDYYNALRYLGNVIVCPSGEVNQMGTTSTADDAYGGPDGWYTLNQSNATSWAQGTNLEDTTPFYQRGTQSNATPQRFGRAQIIESKNCIHMRGQSIVLSARVQLSTTATLRYAILEWTGTADSVTSDVVNDWTSSTYTAGNFFVSTTTNVLAVGSVALTGSTPATITALTATVGSTMNNLVVFFWTEATAAQNVTLDIAKASLKLGTVATPFYPRDYQRELDLCQRYLVVLADASASKTWAVGAAVSTTLAVGTISCPVPFRTAPTIAASAASDFNVTISSGDTAGSSITFEADLANDNGQFTVFLTIGSAALTVNTAVRIRSANTSSKITLDARL